MVEAFRERAIPPPSFSDLCEGLVQIGDYIVDVLGSDENLIVEGVIP